MATFWERAAHSVNSIFPLKSSYFPIFVSRAGLVLIVYYELSHLDLESEISAIVIFDSFI